MGFEKRTYKDGDISFATPAWRKVIENVQRFNERNFLNEINDLKRITADEVTLKHPKSESYVRLCDDGSIEMFTESNCGIRMCADGRMVLFADRIQFLAKQVESISTANGLVANSQNLNTGAVTNFPRKTGYTEGLRTMLCEIDEANFS